MRSITKKVETLRQATAESRVQAKAETLRVQLVAPGTDSA